jgi:signal transduction histidine kinase
MSKCDVNRVRSCGIPGRASFLAITTIKSNCSLVLLFFRVRNPVAAAMAACSFVKTAVNKEPPLVDPAVKDCCRDDVKIIENSLKFVNDLLRNMLDMHRVAGKQIKVDLSPVEILHDVFEPVQAMLTQRGSQFEIVIDCPKNMWVMTDRLRLKQVIMNLGRNSVKFVDRGYIKLAAELVDDEVQLSVSDSGPGIPPDKRRMLFHKFQESLDMLSQGTVSPRTVFRVLVRLRDILISAMRFFPGHWFISV